MKSAVVLLMLLLAALPAWAISDPAEMLPDRAKEARAEQVGRQLRCLVCQNESIDESGADLAHDIRLLVRQRLTAGDTDSQVIQAVVNRYGQFVLLNPPVEPATWALWFAPPALLAASGAGLLIWMRRRRPDAMAPVAPLNAEELERLHNILEKDG